MAHFPISKREWLSQQMIDGKPAAVFPSRGRFSAKAEALAAGHTFADVAAPVSAPAPARVSLVKRAPAVVSEGGKVREWARQQGLTVGDRGRLSESLVAAYKANDVSLFSTDPKPAPRPVVSAAPVVTPAPVVVKPEVRVRRETTGFTFAPRPADAGPHVTEPLVRVSSCGRCAKSIAYCACDRGPVAPAYLGGGILSLDKPDTVC